MFSIIDKKVFSANYLVESQTEGQKGKSFLPEIYVTFYALFLCYFTDVRKMRNRSVNLKIKPRFLLRNWNKLKI